MNPSAFVRRGALLATVALGAAGCIAPPVERTDFGEPVEGAYRKVAVVPFQPWPAAARAGQGVGGPPPEAPPVVSNFVAAALAAEGVDVVFPEDVAAALGIEVEPRQTMDPGELARFAKERFGASAVLLGRVLRWRDREAVGTRPSVAFEVTTHLATTGGTLTRIRFDETQSGITERPSNMFRMPGGGARWLTTVELAQWGAEATAESLLSDPISDLEGADASEAQGESADSGEGVAP